MSIEARISITATFTDEETAKAATSELKKSLKKNNDELSSSLDTLHPIENYIDYKNDSINVESINRKSNVLSISSYTYSSVEPVWFAKSLSQLGAIKIFVRGQWDGVGRNFYFMDGSKVSKKIFDGDKPKNELSEKDIEINKSLFLPEGRVSVKVQLISAWAAGDIYESMILKLKTTCENTIYYKGTGQIVDIFWASDREEFNTSLVVEFSTVLERGKIENEFVSFAKRPTKINVLANST